MAINIKSKKILSPENISKIVMMGLSLKDALSIIEQKCLEEYDEVKTYPKNSYVTYDGYLWKSKSTATGSFSELKWNKIGDDLSLVDIDEIKTMINLSNEEIATLQSLILDSEIRLDKTFSSSKIYMDIQQSLKDSKTYTLEQLAKKTGATYKVVSGTDEVTSSEYLYLISNGTVYDIYAFIDGNSQKIGDTTIDLSDYAKVSDLDNYYTKSDSDGKFATITTLNGKFDKANINTAISNTPSDEKVLSEKAIKSELDLKANDNEVIKRTDITTTIDSSSTDTQVPNAKTVYEELDEKITNDYYKNDNSKKGIVFDDNADGSHFTIRPYLPQNMFQITKNDSQALLNIYSDGTIQSKGNRNINDLVVAYTNELTNVLLVNTNASESSLNNAGIVTSATPNKPSDMEYGVREVLWIAPNKVIIRITGVDTSSMPAIWINRYNGTDWATWRKL